MSLLCDDSRHAKAFREWVMNALCEYNWMEKKPQEMLIVFSQSKSQFYICN
ncbi:hypothetical protein ACOV6A_17820 [Bacteroides fragilis]|uniref:hypothetical protein n=1 Tax=Bacteroides fragilis TaxID=817 RepID=UPI00202FF7F7|nr:hypothetical protein [Bacteroides fragilis]MCM0347367.1 hypothetical protein [Bacteroides fragilis]